MNLIKKKNVILIFIGLIIGMIGISIPIPTADSSSLSFSSFTLPLGSIASTILIIIGALGLRKATYNKTYILVIVLLSIAVVLEFIIPIFFIKPITESLQPLIEIGMNSSEELSPEEAKIVLDIFSSCFNQLAILINLLCIPVVLHSFAIIKLTNVMSNLSNNFILKSKIKKNGLKYGIFSTCMYLVAEAMIFLTFNLFSDLADIVNRELTSLPGFLVIYLVIICVVILPLIIICTVFIIISVVHLLIGMGKLIKEFTPQTPVIIENQQENSNPQSLE